MYKKNIFCSLVMAIITSFAHGQGCNLPISIQLDEHFSNVPAAASTVLYQTLNRVATANGLSAEGQQTPFVITAHCDVLDKSNLPGPPVQTAYELGVTFYFADTFSHKKFATAYVILNGVGNGEVKSYINAFRRINDKNQDIRALIKKGKESMMNYYDANYQEIINEARRAESLQNLEEALALVLAIPTCSRGGEVASSYAVQLYTKNLDRMNLFLLNEAKAKWAAGQSQDVASEVCSILAQIDPDASCYKEAGNLMKEIKSQVRSDIDFEMREKYADNVKTERDYIDAMKAVGVAYGKGQQPSTTNLMWLK